MENRFDQTFRELNRQPSRFSQWYSRNSSAIGKTAAGLAIAGIVTGAIFYDHIDAFFTGKKFDRQIRQALVADFNDKPMEAEYALAEVAKNAQSYMRAQEREGKTAPDFTRQIRTATSIRNSMLASHPEYSNSFAFTDHYLRTH